MKKKGSSEIDSKLLNEQFIQNVEIKECCAHKSWITRVLIIEDLDSIVTSSLDSSIHFHGIEDYKYKRTCKLHQKGINDMIWSKSNRFFASCGEERQV